jgi:hypothetical protein
MFFYDLKRAVSGPAVYNDMLPLSGRISLPFNAFNAAAKCGSAVLTAVIIEKLSIRPFRR